jgi:hypothetical protein
MSHTEASRAKLFDSLVAIFTHFFAKRRSKMSADSFVNCLLATQIIFKSFEKFPQVPQLASQFNSMHRRTWKQLSDDATRFKGLKRFIVQVNVLLKESCKLFYIYILIYFKLRAFYE